MLIIYKFF